MRRALAAVVLAAVALVLAASGAARAQDAPAAAKKRFEEAHRLGNQGDFSKAAAAFREVADWPEGGDFSLRAKALYCAALQFESTREYEKELATLEEVATRFPQSGEAQNARTDIEKLAPPGSRGIEFHRRFVEAWDVFLPTKGEPTPAEVQRALGLFESLLHDHREHPRAHDVALAIGEARTKLGDPTGARDAFADAVSLAKREAAKRGADAATDGEVVNAETKLAEAKRALLRRWLDRIAKVGLVLALGVFVSVRPWRSSPRPLLRLAAKLIAADGVLALVAVGVAEYVRRFIDDHSPLEDSAAALLVLGPGLVGIIVSLGIVNAGRGTKLAAAAGAVAGASLAIMLIYAYGLFPFLDSEL